jgi:hypothetical protein
MAMSTASIRRYLTFSLRTTFVFFTAFAAWLGVVVHRAREQREAVEAIKALGGVVQFDWQADLKRVSKIKVLISMKGLPRTDRRADRLG